MSSIHSFADKLPNLGTIVNRMGNATQNI